MSLSRNELRLALARGYAHPYNKSKPIDIELIEAMLDEVMVAMVNAIRRAEPVITVLLQRDENDDDRHPAAS